MQSRDDSALWALAGLLAGALVVCALAWALLLSAPVPAAPASEPVPVVYDTPAPPRTLVIEEPTGRSWWEYDDGTVVMITEGDSK